ncbi:phospholipid carrier-dependent glycosyltransferase [Nocardioides phosphati]|uniref:Polyprenol-phosphate-mannose--protein mannosyltransferase n=1 Tax=Nocardioides phosphati TaxID=1867775 RepID=A0ABQ2N614_9ACTN|nr:phospholipid carrier-dependent glycosyltransferase [Nocardioides phosphati]GGO83979.1 phospholipid carrier-dependent glycosyltransferase [Nocardioides phosphati]
MPETSPSAAERGRPPAYFEGRLVGWLASLAVFGLALFLRLWHLGRPHEFAFDETYYAKDAWSMLHFGYARNYVEDADKHILAGHTTGQWTSGPEMVVHPDVGKWLIALGEKAFGMDPFGWRVASAVTGALMVLVMVRLARRVTGSTMLGVVAGLLLCFDGMQLVLSRLALLDIFLAFFILLGVHCIVADRQWMRLRVMTQGRQRILFRPWLLAAGVSFGLACGTKWTAIYPLAAFGVVVWLWSAGARRAAGTRLAFLKSVVLDGLPAFVHLVGVALVVYVASWGGWLAHAHAYEENLSATQYHRYVSWDGTCTGGTKSELKDVKYDDSRVWSTAGEKDASGLGEITQSLHSLWLYHQDVYRFHTTFLNCSTHTYASDPGGWILLSRPVSASVTNDIKPGTDGCDAAAGSHCIREVLILGNPVVWWGGALALIASVVLWVARRDWRHGIAVVGVAATWLPWELNDKRPIFSFYASAFAPFLVLSIVLVMGHLLGPDRGPSTRRTTGTVVAGTFVVLTIAAAAWFWPVWTGDLLTIREWQARMWFSRWI